MRIFYRIIFLAVFLFRLSRPAAASELVLLNDNVKEFKGKGIIVMTHGWVQGIREPWYKELAREIYQKVDQKQWLVGYFDWEKESMKIKAESAAKHARETAGLELAEALLLLDKNFEHIHLLGHSSGAWCINTAVNNYLKADKADVHLTFFDAYVPAEMNGIELGKIECADVNIFVEQYYSRDITGRVTEVNLSNAHNLDVTEVDLCGYNHDYPWQWYYAIIAGRYPKFCFCDYKKLKHDVDGFEYGFIRSLECGGEENWKKSLLLEKGNIAPKIKRDKK